MKTFLKKISKVKTSLIKQIKITKDNEIINTAIFKNDFNGNLEEYKKIFIKELSQKNNNLLKIIKEINNNKNLSDEEIKILLSEINIKQERIKFLGDTYDIEAKKIDRNYKYKEEKIDYNYYNKIFFLIDSNILDEKVEITKKPINETKITRKTLLELIKYSNSIIPDIKFNFGKFNIFSHNYGVLNIPDKKEYTLQSIITLFFHETTHFFRWFNGKNNLGFDYQFGDYASLEEGIAIYNEYFYGNKITNYGEFTPYYDTCYKVLTENISEKDKQEKIYNILKYKGYNRKKSLSYYYRFYKYSKIGGKSFFLKDLIYNIGLKNVKTLLIKNKDNYEKIMSGRIGLETLDRNIISDKKNFDSKEYFDKMTLKIKSLI